MDYVRRITTLEKLAGGGECSTCAKLARKPLFLKASGKTYSGEVVKCPRCGRTPQPRKTYIGIDPDAV